MNVNVHAMRRVLSVVVLVAACGKGASSDKRDNNKPAGDEPERVTSHELATAPLETATGTIGAMGFSLQLPVSLLRPAKLEGTNVTWEPKKAWLDTPDFTVSFLDMPLPEDSTGTPTPISDEGSAREIARAEKLPGGGYLHLDQRKDHAFFELEVCRPVTGGQLCCSVIQRADKPIAGFTEIVGLAEKVCTSLKPQ